MDLDSESVFANSPVGGDPSEGFFRKGGINVRVIRGMEILEHHWGAPKVPSNTDRLDLPDIARVFLNGAVA